MSSATFLGTFPKLGVGVLFNGSLPQFLKTNLSDIDYLAIIPENFWTDRGVGQSPRYEEIDAFVDLVRWTAERRPIVGHSIGLSLGSAELFDDEHVAQLAGWQRRFDFRWHSDHLAYVRMTDQHGGDHNAGMALPIPYDHDVLEMVEERVRTLQNRMDAPFLLENNVYYVNIPEQEMTEPQFLNRLTERTGCGLLLDLHNVYTNARNHGFDPKGFIDELNLESVIEVHVAGGEEFADMYTDAHSGPCPEAVWECLDHVVRSAPNLCAVTFEFHESAYPRLLIDGILDQLGQARDIWNRYR